MTSSQDAGTERPKWERRWLVVRLTLVLCAAIILYATAAGADDGVREAALFGAFSLAAATVLGYCGFAVQDDANFMRLRRERP